MNRIDLYARIFRIGGFFRPLSMMILKPEDLATLSRRYYSMKNTIKGYSDPALVDSGLMSEEADLLDQVPAGPNPRVLVLGIGGGRTALGLGQKGYEVYGMDHSLEMVSIARQNCDRWNIRFHGVVQEASRIGFRPGSFDLVFFTPAFYSVIPTQKRRREMLKRVSYVLKPRGHVICQFFWKKDLVKKPVKETLKKITALLTRGYTEYETGDRVRDEMEFLHAFHDQEILFSEFHGAGFFPVQFTVFQNGFFGGALLQQNS